MADLDKNKIGAAFDRAAHQYDGVAQFQHAVCDHLLTLLPEMPLPLRILDGGCGTGYGATRLQQHWQEANVLGCDLAPAMVRQTAARGVAAVCGDLENLPFDDASFDLAWSSLALQWCQPALAYAELQRVLAPGGRLVFATLAAGTLHELDAAFAGIDGHRRSLPLAPLAQIEADLRAAGFTQIDLQQVCWVTRHADFKTLLASIRGIGANQTGGERRRGMMGKDAWRTVQARYQALQDENGLLPATYQVVFGIASRQR